MTVARSRPRPVGWLEGRLTTTPARLRLVAAVVAFALLAFGIAAATAAGSRRHAADAVATQTEPLVVQADILYSKLSDAEATATATFLTGGIEPVARRERYSRDIRSATAQLTALTREIGNSPDAQADVEIVAANVPTYDSLVATARADNRQGLPVGAAYLRQASTLMRATILPAARHVYEVEARRLGSDYGTGTSASTFVAVAGFALVVLILLVLAQLYVARRSNRLFNVPLVVASVLVVGIVSWSLGSFVVEQNALSKAQRNGSDLVEVLSATRILLLRAGSDESLALVARGGGDQYNADFDAVLRALGRPDGSTGLLAEASKLAQGTDSTEAFAELTTTIGRYEATHRRITAIEANGDFQSAAALAVGTHAKEAPLVSRMNRELESQISSAQARFTSSASRATRSLRGLWPGIVLVVAGALVLALLGFGMRLREYR